MKIISVSKLSILIEGIAIGRSATFRRGFVRIEDLKKLIKTLEEIKGE